MKNYRILITVAGGFLSAASFWMFLPVLSVSLRADGISDLYVGIISGLPWVGLLAVSAFIPRLTARLGLQRTILAGMLLSALAFLGFASTRLVWFWCLLCLLQGTTMGLRWAAMDTWISSAVPEHARGRMVGLYELAASGSLAAGPAFLAITGVAGSRPFLAAAAIITLATLLILLGGRETQTPAPQARHIRFLDIWRFEPAAITGIALVGLTEACNLSLLPLYGLSSGDEVHTAALLVVAVQIGGAAGAVICGAASDHLNRRALHLTTSAATLLLPLAVPLLLQTPAIWPLLILWGFAQGGLFTLGMVLLGSRFKATALAPAVALSMVAYTIGGIIGPPLLGMAMTNLGPTGLPYGLALFAAASLALIGLSGPVLKVEVKV